MRFRAEQHPPLCGDRLWPQALRPSNFSVTTRATSPAASGPAGSLFEAQVGAHYLLSLLVGTEPRGLPGTVINRVAFQKAAEGRALDDCVIHAHERSGGRAVLEIQVTRNLTFTPSDTKFQAVVAQIARSAKHPDFALIPYELAVAIASSSHKIDGAYQQVLGWARQMHSSTAFFAQIERRHVASEDMRQFVVTFRDNLVKAGASSDDETVWQLLKRLQILIFDFTATSSAAAELAKERAIRALHPNDAARAAELWKVLIELALNIASSAGERSRHQLLEDLQPHSFRIVGDRRSAAARAALAEAAEQALDDIEDRVGNVTLARSACLEAVHEGSDKGRYVEIRGDGGVGKSVVLKHRALLAAMESRIVVLSPQRTIAGGWLALKSVLQFDGSAPELLADLAADGGGVLFIDGLDFFNDDARVTVRDLVRAAAKVPGFAVIVTARRNFGIDEPNWLPAEALEQLGQAPPVLIEELTDTEISELRQADPRLGALLGHNHPAQAVTRNLFRLAHQASRPLDEPAPSTEVDMAQRWWNTADGKLDGGHRDRSRVLRFVAAQALGRVEPADVSQQESSAVDALVQSGTLRDLRNDRVTFRHDVLRDWAVANYLVANPAAYDQLPMAKPAPATLARAVELAARIILEANPDSSQWESLLARLSRVGAHGSWRRSVLLAIVRSEIGVKLLEHVSGVLTVNQAELLRELIRTVLAVDGQPASKLFAAFGLDKLFAIPASLNAPNGPSWSRLIVWLLQLGAQLPAAAVPEVVRLYTDWLSATLGADPLAPRLLTWLFRWLSQIEGGDGSSAAQAEQDALTRDWNREQINEVASDLRMGFLLFCNKTPALAEKYLDLIRRRPHSREAVHSILKFRGALAQAAPAALAQLTEDSLIPPSPGRRRAREDFNEPFDCVDRQFLPASPAQGPFLELLTHAPAHGLALVRKLVSHAVAFHSRGRSPGADVLLVAFPDDDRTFPWMRTYNWSRDPSGAYCITSGLMALEGWAHQRVEAGNPIDQVLADVFGPPGSPAAMLLVAVDLVLSHWPQSREVAIPFLACPELLCLDRQRRLFDQVEVPDLFGLKAHQKEPSGQVMLDSLKRRPSRQGVLEDLLPEYTMVNDEARKRLLALLRGAADRLGPPAETSDLGDPAFMAEYALNLLDPQNWQRQVVRRPDGTEISGYQYVSPEAERLRLERRRDAANENTRDLNMQLFLGQALDKPANLAQEAIVAAAEWAQQAHRVSAEGNADQAWMRDQAVVTAAMILARDGDDALYTRCQTWAHGVLTAALQPDRDEIHEVRTGLRFNPVGIGVVGLVAMIKRQATPAASDVRLLLEAAAADHTSGAYGLAATAAQLTGIDARYPRALLRCAFAARIQPDREWNTPEAEVAARRARHQQRIQHLIEAELSWLTGNGPEPGWPEFPVHPPQRRPRMPFATLRAVNETAVPEPPTEFRVDHRGAAIWLKAAMGLIGTDPARLWLPQIVRAYGRWTAEANGAGLDSDEEISADLYEWNDVYFEFLAHVLPDLSDADVDQTLVSVTSLPDEQFCGVVTPLLTGADQVCIDRHVLSLPLAVRLRTALADRLLMTAGWRRLAQSSSNSIERSLGTAVAVMFFNEYSFAVTARCYLLAPAVERIDPFLPVLAKLIVSGPSLFVAHVALNLIEVSPRKTHLALVSQAAKTWMTRFANETTFWIDHRIGARICAIFEAIRCSNPATLSPGQVLRGELDELLAFLVRLGAPEASRLESSLIEHP